MSSVRKLVVEVVDAKDLLPKDGYGTSSPYVILYFHGQRKRTQTSIRDISPTWNEVLEFNVGKQSDVLGDMLELDVFHDKNFGPTRRNNFLGRVRLDSRQFVKKGEEVLIYYPLEKKHLFCWIQGEIGLKIYFSDEVAPLLPVLEAPIPEAEVKYDSAEKSEPPPEPAQVPPPETLAEVVARQEAPIAEKPPSPKIELAKEADLVPPPELPQVVEAESAPPPSNDSEISTENDDQVERVLPEPIGLNAFRATRSVSDLNIGGSNGLKPIPRSASSSEDPEM